MGGSLPFPVTRDAPADVNNTPIQLSFPTHGDSQVGLIAQIKLCAPTKLNALRSVDFQQLVAILDWINEQPHILITVLTGSGRFFSAGADVSDAGRILPEEITSLPETDPIHLAKKRAFYTQRAHMNNRRLGQAFYNHNKILVGAMNGPVVGISAAFLSHCDFIYCFEEFFLLTPFSSLALVAEEGSSATFVKKVSWGRKENDKPALPLY
jgi:peroxisomal 3,2-trans-enoyl-CoA isomerase